jgi:hypothetical protein
MTKTLWHSLVGSFFNTVRDISIMDQCVQLGKLNQNDQTYMYVHGS